MTAGGPRFRAVFAEAAWREDMRRYRASPEAQRIAVAARREAEDHGIEPGRLARCRAEDRNGTRLPNCVKLYLPPEAAEPRFRMVFAAAVSAQAPAGMVLAYLAFGVSHHPPEANAPTVYELADLRLRKPPNAAR